MGFLASAVLPAEDYLVSDPLNYKLLLQPRLTLLISVSLRVSHRGSQRSLRLHSAAPRLAIFESAIHRGGGPSHRTERIIRRARSDRRCMDLQKRGGEEGLPNRPLDQRSTASLCNSWMCTITIILRVEK